MSPPIRVAMTLTQDWHAVPGGTAAAANALAATLSHDGRAQVTGVVPAGAAPGAPWNPPVPTVALRLPVPYLYDAWHHLRRPRVTSVAPSVDLVHLTVPIACPPESVPMVATVHDVFPLTMPQMFNRRGVRLMTRGLKRIRSEAARVMVPTEAGAAEFVSCGFDRGRLAVVPLGVTVADVPDRGQVDSTLARHRLESPYVLFVGTAEPRKGLDVLLRAIERLDRPGLTLVLAGPDGWGDTLGDGLARLGDRVKRLGFVPEDDLLALRTGAAVCCLPSRAEGFGLPVLEAMAAGVPVVTTLGTPMAEFADGVASLVPVGDHHALAEAIAAVLDDPAVAGEMGAAGRERAMEFNWQRTVDGVLEVYSDVLGQ